MPPGMGNVNMDDAQVAFDESGRPFIILRDQGKTNRLRGIDAHKSNILAGKTVANILRSSLGALITTVTTATTFTVIAATTTTTTITTTTTRYYAMWNYDTSQLLLRSLPQPLFYCDY